MTSRPTRLASFALALVLGAALLAACSDDDGDGAGGGAATSSSTTTEPRGAGWQELGPDDDLYALAEGVEPGEPGELIAVQEVAGVGLDGTVYRVLHHSQSLEGDDIAVSGLVAVPDGPAPDGGRRVLTWAHGTTGIADDCAPSKDAESSGFELAAPFLERDMVVVATDYEGLGTPGRHPYLVGESEGRGVLDIVQAARQMVEVTGAGDEVVVWGHSQGGHAALFANQIATEWAPQLDVLGTVAGAPPSQLPLFPAALGNSPFRHYLAMVVAGWSAAYPEADPAGVMTDAALERLPTLDERCGADLAAPWQDLTYEDLAKADPTDVEPWATLLVENDPGFEVGASPVLIVHGEADEQIPLISSELLLERMCEVGQVVARRTYPGQTHGGVVGASMPDVLAWIDARVAGEPAPDDCAP